MKYLSYLILLIALFTNNCGEAQTEVPNDEAANDEKPIKRPAPFNKYLDRLAQIVDTSDIRRFEKEILKFEKEDTSADIPGKAIVFVGSSSVRKWHSLSEDMHPIPVLNRGFGGSTLAEAIYYFPRTAQKYQPQAIVLYEGDNDLSAAGISPEQFMKLFELFVNLRDEYLPECKLYFLSIKPSPARRKYLPAMMRANRLAEDYCKLRPDIEYIDVSTAMFDEKGKIRSELFIQDRLHLNDSGYALWTKIVKKALSPR